MADRGPPLVLGSRGQIAQTGHYVYVDNIGIVRDHVAQVHMGSNESRQDFEESRLMLHEISVSFGSGRAVGFRLNVEHADPSNRGTFWSHLHGAPMLCESQTCRRMGTGGLMSRNVS